MSMPQGDRLGQPRETDEQPGPPMSGPPMSGPPVSGGPLHGRPVAAVSELETRVTGRRIVQFIIDAIIVGIVAGVLSRLLSGGGTGLRVVYIILDVAWTFSYWTLLPYLRSGQTVGMQVMGLRVISRDGGPPRLSQFGRRTILLVLFVPLSLLVGFITMMCSPYRQRVGDHWAKTVVVSSQPAPASAYQAYAGAGQGGAR
jgi:uncharacterized RDD family membrane protein YckC